MNRFRKRREAREALEGFPRPSNESDTPSITPVKKTFRRGKKTAETEPKAEIDLSSALPSSDEFRTSLLMSGLSARFSMLREQDDPKSKKGKASDDSVLYPKRQSRMNDFGRSGYGLSNIAEVSSLHSLTRQPTMTESDNVRCNDKNGRSAQDQNLPRGVMNRSRPGEGNILFGGRQKINVGNRVLYDDDVRLSSFQKQRKRERELRQEIELEDPQPSYFKPNSPNCYSYTDEKNKLIYEHQHSNSSNTPRDYTIRTGTESDRNIAGSSEPSKTRNRRLYETGLENHLHQQHSMAMSRIDTISQQRSHIFSVPSPKPSPTSAAIENNGWITEHSTEISKSHNFIDITSHRGLSTQNYGIASPPLSPPSNEKEEGLYYNRQNSEKATNLQAGAQAKAYNNVQNNSKHHEIIESSKNRRSENSPTPKEYEIHQNITERNRSQSNSSYGSSQYNLSSSLRGNLAPDQPCGSSQSKSITVPLEPTSSSSTPPLFTMLPRDHESLSKPLPPPKDDINPKYLGLLSFHHQHQAKQKRPSISQHPLYRSHKSDFEANSEIDPNSSHTRLIPLQDSNQASQNHIASSEINGMVRQHMRFESNASSVYGAVTENNPLSSLEHPISSSFNEYTSIGNPWENTADDNCDEIHKDSLETNLAKQNDHTTPHIFLRSSENAGANDKIVSSDKETSYFHTRQVSTDSEREQKDLMNEFANRRRHVKEKMKSFVESDNSLASPSQTVETPRESNPKNSAFGILRTKNSRGSVKPKDGQSKTLKMLGLGNVTSSSTVSSRLQISEESVEDDEASSTIGRSSITSLTSASRQTRRDQERQMPTASKKSEAESSDTSWNAQTTKNQLRPQQSSLPSNNDRTLRVANPYTTITGAHSEENISAEKNSAAKSNEVRPYNIDRSNTTPNFGSIVSKYTSSQHEADQSKLGYPEPKSFTSSTTNKLVSSRSVSSKDFTNTRHPSTNIYPSSQMMNSAQFNSVSNENVYSLNTTRNVSENISENSRLKPYSSKASFAPSIPAHDKCQFRPPPIPLVNPRRRQALNQPRTGYMNEVADSKDILSRDLRSCSSPFIESHHPTRNKSKVELRQDNGVHQTNSGDASSLNYWRQPETWNTERKALVLAGDNTSPSRRMNGGALS